MMTSEHTLIVEAGRSEKQYWIDLWRYRELFYFLSWRDILVRYKQTILGIAWSVLRPFLTLIIFTIVFGKLAKMTSSEAPYSILVFTAVLPWQFFSNSFAGASESLISNTTLLTKVYFPRIIIPATSLIVSLIDFLFSFAMLIVLMAWFRFVPDWKIVLIPAFLLMAFVTAFGAGLFISAINVKYRDFRHVVPFLIQFGLYVSPVGFSSNIIPQKWKLLYFLNPIAGVIQGFRWAIIGGNEPFYVSGFLESLVVSLVLLWSGISYFRATERNLADYL